MPPTEAKRSGQGVTSAIREQLNFLDDVKWKEFSNRRLELIDRFNLSSKKASEQDQNISQIAELLRIEFGFPPETLSDFDKLVRAAVQSVRRNRKRSSRARVNYNRFVIDEKARPTSVMNPNESLFSNTSSLGSTPLLGPSHLFNHDNDNSGDSGSSLNDRLLLSTHPLNTYKGNISRNNFTSDGGSSSSTMSNSLATSPNASAQLPSLKSVLIPTSVSTPLSIPLLSTGAPSTMPQSNSKKKLLKSIENSKTCLLLSDNSPAIHEHNLFILGQSIVTASISFVLERFFQDISKESISYLSEKLNHPSTISKILKSLGFNSTEVMNLNDTQANNLFCKLMGCCVKDFGFDANCYNLCEIFHEVILNEYPLVGTQITKISKESLFTPLLPMIPKDADKEVTKIVKLRFAGKVLEFKYFPLSNAPPTFLELVENGRTGFGISSAGGENDSRMFRLRHDGVDVSNDSDLEKLFRDLSIPNLDLELYEMGKGMNFTPLL